MTLAAKRLGIILVARPSHGGQFQYSLAMVEALCRLSGWHMTIYRPQGSDSYDGFGLEQRDLRQGRFAALILALARWVGIRMADALQDEDFLIAPMYAPQLLHTRKPFCYTLHDLQEYYFPEYFTLYQRVWRRFLHGRMARTARYIICESDFVRQDIRKFLHVMQDNIRVIPAPPLWEGATEAAGSPEAVVRRYNLPAHFLFYPAQFWEHKNHVRLLQAFARIAPQFPHMHLVFTGHRRFRFDAVFDQVRQLGLSDRVHHIGYVESTDILPLYRLATGLVMPSLFESISIPIYEAFRAGTPVCASGVLGLSEQIGDAGLMFDPWSVDGMADAMTTLLRDADLRKTLARRGQEKLASLTIDHYAAQLQALLAEMEPH